MHTGGEGGREEEEEGKMVYRKLEKEEGEGKEEQKEEEKEDVGEDGEPQARQYIRYKITNAHK